MDETSEYFLRMFVSRAGKTVKLTICPRLVLVLKFLVVPVGRSSMNSDFRKKHLVNGHLKVARLDFLGGVPPKFEH